MHIEVSAQSLIPCTRRMPTPGDQGVHPIVNREETLSAAQVLETPQLPLPLPGRFLGHFRSVVGVLVGIAPEDGTDARILFEVAESNMHRPRKRICR